MDKNVILFLIVGIIIIAGCAQQQNTANGRIAKTTHILHSGEIAKTPNGYAVKFSGLPFADCPSGLSKEVNAEVSGVELTLLNTNSSPLRDSLGNTKKVIICKGSTVKVEGFGGISIGVIDFKYAEYPSGKPEIPASAEIVISS